MQPIDRSKFAQCTGCACGNLRMATRAITQFFDQMLEPSGLRATQFGMLVAIAVAGPTTISPLAESLVMDRTTLTRNLRRLEKQGLVEIEAGADQRTRVVTLTAQGHAALAQALPLWEQAQARVVKSLGQEQLSALQDMLSAVVALTHGT